jgi:homoserine kinase type II
MLWGLGLYGIMNENFQHILSHFYDLGQLIDIEQNDRGYINETYGIKLLKGNKKDRYFLRRYKKGTLKERIKFEHALMNELIEQGFNISPRVIPAKDLSTFVNVCEKKENYTESRYVSIFSCLPGKDKYSWDAPLCTDAELKDAAKVLAFYHSAIHEWKGTSDWVEKRHIDRISLMTEKWRLWAQNAGQSSFDQYFLGQFEYLFSILRKTQFTKIYNEMPHLVIHGDYHPGNLKFLDGKVIGVFDFDWSKMDIRCFDVAIALLFFCSGWDEIDEGNLLLGRAESFLEAYQKAADEVDGIGPMNMLELEHLPEMIHLSNISLIDWILEAFYAKHSGPLEFKTYLRHSVHVMQWMERNRDQLYKCVLGMKNIH